MEATELCVLTKKLDHFEIAVKMVEELKCNYKYNKVFLSPN